MNREIKNHLKKIANIRIEYIKYGFVSNFSNCLLVKIEKGKCNKDSLLFLTEEGKTRSVDIEDSKNIFVSISPIW